MAPPQAAGAGLALLPSERSPPRFETQVGNRAFAALHRGAVRSAFQVVNDQDPVPRVPTTGGCVDEGYGVWVGLWVRGWDLG
jgi:hypothetical protein